MKLTTDVIAEGKMNGMAFRKVCLPKTKDSKPKPGSACWIAGWTRGTKKKLKSVDVNILKERQCNEYKGKRFMNINFSKSKFSKIQFFRNFEYHKSCNQTYNKDKD